MSRNFIIRGIVLPIAAAAVVSIVFVFIVNFNISSFLPVTNGARLAYYDKLDPQENPVSINSGTVPNDMVGSLNSSFELPLRYEADYSNRLESASLSAKSAGFDETGCAYICIASNQVPKISTDEPLTVTTADGEYTYEFQGEKLMKSEADVLSLAPPYKHSVVIYYRVTKGIGLTTDYYALIYKGVS